MSSGHSETGEGRSSGHSRRPRLGQKGMVVAGCYELRAFIGAGGFGEVWEANQLARAKGSGSMAIQKVAVKMMPVGGGPTLKALFNEVLAVRDLDCPALARIYDAGIAEEQGIAYIAMELLVGETLAQRLKRSGPIYWRRALHIALAVARALEQCHRRNLIHADLKPENIYLEGRGKDEEVVRVLDFGIAQIAHQAPSTEITQLRRDFVSQNAESTSVTDTALNTDDSDGLLALPMRARPVLGTAGFVPAEVLRGAAPGPSTDAFALGVVLFTMIGGKLPQKTTGHALGSTPGSRSPGSRRRALNVASMSGDLATADDLNVPPAVGRLIDQLLSSDSEQRLKRGLVRELTEVWNAPWGVPDPPYHGLAAFSPEMAGHLRGRDADARALAEKLRDLSFVTLLGPSGAGKSSLAAAGVGPELDKFFMLGTDGWTVRVVRPSTWPNMGGLDSLPPRETPHSGARPIGTLIVVDQLEEILSLSPEARARVVPQIVGLMHGKLGRLDEYLRVPGPWRCLVTLRDGLLGRVAEHLDRGLESAVYILRAVDPNGIADLITAPAMSLGYTIENQSAVIEEAKDMLERDARALPLVQFGMTRWWELRDQARRRLTANAWKQLGGFDGAVGKAAEEVFESLNDRQRAVMRSLFLRLFDLEGTRQRVPDTYVDPVSSNVVDRLIQRRLVRRSGGAVPALEVVHEALARQDPVRGWLEATRSERELLANLAHASEYWLKHGRRSDDLWKGTWLKETSRLKKLGALPDLNETSIEFIDLSERLVRRERRQQFLIPAAIIFLAGVLTAMMAQSMREDMEQLTVESALLVESKELSENELKKASHQLADYKARGGQLKKKNQELEKKAQREEEESRRLAKQNEAVQQDLKKMTATRDNWLSSLNTTCQKAQGFDYNVRNAALPMVDYYLADTASDAFTRLTKALRSEKDCLKDHYPPYVPGYQFRTESKPAAPTRWILRHSALQQLDHGYLSVGWDEMLSAFENDWGFIPDGGEFREDIGLKANVVTVGLSESAALETTAEGDTDVRPEEPLKLEVPLLEGYACLSSAEGNLEGPRKKYFKIHRRKYVKYEQLRNGGPWWLVPQWTVPIWNSDGVQRAFPAEHCLMVQIANALQDKPRWMVSDKTTAQLLDHFAERYPVTVAEARAARGDRLGDDLLAILRNKSGLGALPVLLDLLADNPNRTGEQVAALADEWTLTEANVELRKRPWPKVTFTDEPACATKHPLCSPPIQVVMGDNATQAFVGEGKLRPETNELIDEIRADLQARYGVPLPGVRFRIDDSLSPDETRILWLHDSLDAGTPLQESSIDALRSEMLFGGEAFARFWVTPEWVYNTVNAFPEPLARWLKANFSVTDLKRVYRGLVDGSEGVGLGSIEWLTASLIFWRRIDPELPGLIKALQQTRHALKESKDAETVSTQVKEALLGVAALSAGRVSEAERAFADAIRMDRDQAQVAFLTAYSEIPRRDSKNLVARCRNSEELGDADVKQLLKLIDERALGSEDALWAGYCAWKNTYTLETRYRTVLRRLLTAGAPPGLSASGRFEVGRAALSAFERNPAWRGMLERGSAWVKAAVTEEGEAMNRTNMVYRLLNQCRESALGPHWCDPLLADLNQSADLEMNALFGIIAHLTYSCCKTVCNARTEAVLDKAQAKNAKGPVNHVEGAILDLLRAQYLVQAKIGHGHLERLAEVEALLRPLLTASEPVGIADDARRTLKSAYRTSGVMSKMTAQLQDTACAPGGVCEVEDQMLMVLRQGDTSSAVAIAERIDMKDIKTDARTTALFARAIAAIISDGVGDWQQRAQDFLKTEHGYRPYIAMMLYARLRAVNDESAKHVLEHFWEQIRKRRQHWPARAAAGDVEVWREMLIGYFLGKVPEAEVLAPLESDEALSRSILRDLPYTRAELQAEGYFYDAMRRMATGRDWRPRLRQVVESNVLNYWEYGLAKAMLKKSPPAAIKKQRHLARGQ